jgi:hypothetical protein
MDQSTPTTWQFSWYLLSSPASSLGGVQGDVAFLYFLKGAENPPLEMGSNNK